MGRKKKHVDYRQLYKDYYGIEFGNDMVVHHIDFDRSNNSISNLILLPRKLHSQYHFAISKLGGAKTGIIALNAQIGGQHAIQAVALKQLGEALDEMFGWELTKGNMEIKRAYKSMPRKEDSNGR